MSDKECPYTEWAEKSEEFWRQRCRDFLGDEYTNLLRVVKAAEKERQHHIQKWTEENYLAYSYDWEETFKALKEVEHLPED